MNVVCQEDLPIVRPKSILCSGVTHQSYDCHVRRLITFSIFSSNSLNISPNSDALLGDFKECVSDTFPESFVVFKITSRTILLMSASVI